MTAQSGKHEINLSNSLPRWRRGVFNQAWPLILSLVLAAAIGLSGFWLHRNEEEAEIVEIRNELSSITELKIAQVARWRMERLGDGRLITATPFLASSAAKCVDTPGGSGCGEDFIRWLDMLVSSYDYRSAVLADTRFERRTATAEDFPELPYKEMEDAARTGGPILSDLHSSSSTAPYLHMDLVAPIFSPVSKTDVVAFLILRINPSAYLFPLVASWPLPRATGSSFLMRAEGDRIEVLGPSQGSGGPGNALLHSGSSLSKPFSRMMNGEPDFLREADSLGKPFFAFRRGIPGTNWILVSKMDAEVALESLNRHAMAVGITLGLLVLAGELLAALLWNSQRGNAYRKMYQTEVELRESEEKYRTLFETMVQGVVYQAVDGSIMDANPAALRILGLTLDQLKGRTSEDPRWHAVHENGSDFPGEAHPSMIALRTGMSIFHEVMGIHNPASDEYRWISINAVPQFRSGENTPYQVYTTFQDITWWKREEEFQNARLGLLQYAVDHSIEDLLREVLIQAERITGSSLGFFHIYRGTQGTITHRALPPGETGISHMAEDWKGPFDSGGTGAWADCMRERRPVVRNAPSSINPTEELPEGNAPITRELVAPVIRGDRIEAVLGVGNKSKDYMEWEISAVARLADLSWEIVERKQMERALRESEELYRTLIEASPDAISLMNTAGNLLFASPRALELYKHSSLDDVIGRSMMHWAAPEERERVRERMTRLLGGEALQPSEYTLLKEDGSRFSGEVSSSVLRSSEGTPRGMVVITRDITRRKKMQRALSESEERYRNVVETVFDLVWEVDDQARYTYVSPRVRDMLGYEPDEILGRTPFDFMPAEEAQRVRPIFDVFAAECRSFKGVENTWRHKDGHLVFLETSGVPVLGLDGKFLGLRGVDRDVTERRQFEEERARVEKQSRQAQKLEALGTLAGGIAHDFNNILSAIIGYTELAMDDVPGGSSLRKDLQSVLTAANRAKELVRQILTFSRQSERENAPLEIGPIVKEVIKLLRATLPSTIEIRQTIALSGRSTILADPTEIHQVIMNLCTNAAHAMRESGGTLEVNLGEQTLSEPDLPDPDLAPGSYLKLRISDTGHGMEEEILNQIFNPFFTTKPKGQGTGMGLAVVHGIVKRCNGAVTVSSRPGEGSTFCLFFPKVVVEPSSGEGELSQEVSTGKGCILLVDDEAPLAELGRKMIERLGYSVTIKTDSRGALATIRSMPRAFDLLISDYTMPHMTGLELAREARHVRPDLPVILCSGYNEVVNQHTYTALDLQGFVPKPLDRQVMAAAIKKVFQDRCS